MHVSRADRTRDLQLSFASIDTLGISMKFSGFRNWRGARNALATELVTLLDEVGFVIYQMLG
jgi:hypothetical protein